MLDETIVEASTSSAGHRNDSFRSLLILYVLGYYIKRLIKPREAIEGPLSHTQLPVFPLITALHLSYLCRSLRNG